MTRRTLAIAILLLFLGAVSGVIAISYYRTQQDAIPVELHSTKTGESLVFSNEIVLKKLLDERQIFTRGAYSFETGKFVPVEKISITYVSQPGNMLQTYSGSASDGKEITSGHYEIKNKRLAINIYINSGIGFKDAAQKARLFNYELLRFLIALSPNFNESALHTSASQENTKWNSDIEMEDILKRYNLQSEDISNFPISIRST